MARPRNLRPTLIERNDGRKIVKIDGRQITIGRSGEDPKIVERRYADLLKRLAEAPDSKKILDAKGTSFFELIDMFLQSDESPRSLNQRRRFALVDSELSDCFGQSPIIASYDGNSHRQFKEWMKQQNDTGHRWKRATMNDLLSRIRRLMKFAQARRLVDADNMLQVVGVKNVRHGDAPESDVVEAVNIDDVEATLPYMPDEIRPIVRLQLLCGARAGELMALRLSDIDRTSKPWHYRPKSHKNSWRNQERNLYFGPKARKIILEIAKGKSETDYFFSPARSMGLVYDRKMRVADPKLKNRSRKYLPYYVAKRYQRWVIVARRQANAERAKKGQPLIEEWTSHQLRHRCATEIRSKMSADHARAVLGHTMPGMTARYTIESDRRLAKEAMEMMG